MNRALSSEPARRAHASRMNDPIETLLFDFGGTLDANGVAWKERFYSYYRAEGLDMAADAFESSFFAADSPLVGKLAPATGGACAPCQPRSGAVAARKRPAHAVTSLSQPCRF